MEVGAGMFLILCFEHYCVGSLEISKCSEKCGFQRNVVLITPVEMGSPAVVLWRAGLGHGSASAPEHYRWAPHLPQKA